MNEIATNTNTMYWDINSLTDTLQQCRKEMLQIVEQMKELDSMWDGAANEAFNIQFANDLGFSEEVFKTVDLLIECMTFAAKEYDICDGEIGSIISHIRV